MNIDDIREARGRISGHIKRTPTTESRSLGQRLGTNVFVKYELFQTTGSFKVRGAFNKMLSLTEDELANGVVAVSGGNHAQAVAYASRELGVEAVIVMPDTTPQNYVDATREYGASIDFQSSIAAAFEKAGAYQAGGRTLIHPFDDPLVMAGQGTLGLEILEDVPTATDVIVSIGGGGLACGVAMAVRSLNPDIRVWGVETVGADSMARALAAGRPVELESITSIAKTLGAPSVSDSTLALTQQYIESVTVITDAEAVRAIKYIAERLKVLTEPAASCTLAAAEKLKEYFGSDSNVVLIFCGGNTRIDDICAYGL